jgi:RNA polymerase sigma-70 factor (ECF subfamily)
VPVGDASKRNELNRLARKAQTGESAAVDALLRELGSRFAAYVGQYVWNRADRDDVVQNALLRVHVGLGSWNPDAPFLSWAFAVFVRACYDYGRREQRKRRLEALLAELAAAEWSAENVITRFLEQAQLRKLIRNLPEERRRALWLAEVEGYTHRQIGLILGRPTGTVNAWLKRDKEWLAKSYEA